DGRLREWDRTTHRLRSVLKKHRDGFTAACYLGPGHVAVATGSRGGVERRALASDQAETLWAGDLPPACSLAVAPNGKLIVAGCEHATAAVFDAATGQLQHRLNTRALDVRCLAISPDGRHVATAGDAEIEIWDTHSGRREHLLPGHDNRSLCLA